MNTIELTFKGLPVHFTGEAFVNSTEMCAIYKKPPNEFLRLATTKRYIIALRERLEERSRVRGIPAPEQVVLTRKGELAGTWLHPWLARRCAQWLEPAFAVRVDEIIDGIMTGDLVIGPAPLPAKLPPFLSEWHHQRFLAKKAAVEELLTAFRTNQPL